MKLYPIILFILLLIPSLKAQVSPSKGFKKKIQINQLENLSVGDKVPNLLIPKIINSSKRSARISDFQDQLLILDFWFTNCPGCVASLPRMDELQKKFENKITILPVTFEPENLVTDFLKKNRITKALNIPSVVEDKILSKLFKHLYDPHEVWIFKGEVIAITDPEYVNERNIQFVLSGKKNEWPVKNDFIQTVDTNIPILQPNPNVKLLSKQRGLKYSAITGYIEGAKSIINGVNYNPINRSRRNYIINLSILNAYAFMWRNINQDLPIPEPNQVCWEVKDPAKYVYNPKWDYRESFKRNYSISYESIRPDSGETIAEQAKIIISDLDHLLGLKGRWEKRKMKSLVLVRTESSDKLKSVGGEEYIDLDKPIKKIRNRPLYSIVWLMNQEAENPRTFDETEYDGMVDLDLNINSWSDIENVRKALQVYGLDLKGKNMDIDMFVLTEMDK